MLKIAVVGDRDSVFGFKAIGIEAFVPDSDENCQLLVESLCSKDYAIIYITEEQAEFCKDTIKKYEDDICPAIILIPGVRNNTGEGMKQLSRSVEKAVGSQLPE